MATNDARKQSLHLTEESLVEIEEQAQRLDRSLSWVVQQAWRVAKAQIRAMPSTNDIVDDDPSDLIR